MEKQKEKRRGLRALLAQPTENFYSQTAAHITGRRLVEIQGCRRVLEIQDGHLCLDMGNWKMDLYGDDLTIRALEGRQAVMEGALKRAEFSPKEEKE